MTLVTKKMIEEHEEKTLAAYAMKSNATRGREHTEEEPTHRSVYQRDRDRIIHCTAFRRLEYKTQVFVNHEGDYYRTRLTHTMEVAQIARSIARALGANEDLTEAIALAHDIGHTPFGHSGEEALNKLMKADGGFEHNRQGLRVVTELERHYPEFPGLNLTWEVRESIVKHRTQYDQPYHPDYDPEKQPVLESQIVDVADSIAYDNHDLDDGLKAGILDIKSLDDIELWRETRKIVEDRYPKINERQVARQTVRTLIDREVGDVTTTSDQLLKKHNVDSIATVQAHGDKLIRFSPALESKKRELQEFLDIEVYKHYRIVRMQRKAMRFLTEIFKAYADHPDQLPPVHQDEIKKHGRMRAVADYIAGMTDRFAQDEYKRLFHPFERV